MPEKRLKTFVMDEDKILELIRKFWMLSEETQVVSIEHELKNRELAVTLYHPTFVSTPSGEPVMRERICQVEVNNMTDEEWGKFAFQTSPYWGEHWDELSIEQHQAWIDMAKLIREKVTQLKVEEYKKVIREVGHGKMVLAHQHSPSS